MLCLLLRIRRQRARVHYATVGARTAKQAGLQFTFHLIVVNECMRDWARTRTSPLITTRMRVYTYIIVQETAATTSLDW